MASLDARPPQGSGEDRQAGAARRRGRRAQGRGSSLASAKRDAPKHLTADQRDLRNRLRAHGRQLGDRRDAKTGAQDTARLVQECAYEHWHRMLFARFLAENDLLIEPESGVAITLDEVQELAREKATDWLELASDYAERMLPQIFRKDDPVLDDRAAAGNALRDWRTCSRACRSAVFEADDSLGWVYQFWQADKKDEVNKSEVKIGADELPAVTQLFTEDYMVLFLLHNTLGAWWAGKVLAQQPGPRDVGARRGRAARRLQGRRYRLDLSALRARQGRGRDEGPWRPAAGDVRRLAEGGEGHHCARSLHGVGPLPRLRAADPRRVPHGGGRACRRRRPSMRCCRDNLFGLEIDPRCTQIAAFNLAFAAWRRSAIARCRSSTSRAQVSPSASPRRNG